MMELGLSAPWFTFRNKIAALFHGDEDVEVSTLKDLGKGKYQIDVSIEDAEKACALQYLIPGEVEMGNITVKINLQVPNDTDDEAEEIDFEAAFEGNPNVSTVRRITNVFGDVFIYVLFKKSSGVVQFYNDNIQDPYGNFNGLISEVAKEVFEEVEGVFYSIDV